MNEIDKTKFVDKRNLPRPERKQIIVYPRCPTCRHFEQFIGADGVPGATVCVIEPPTAHPQIRGEDSQGNVVWAVWHGYPAVNNQTRCSKHASAESN